MEKATTVVSSYDDNAINAEDRFLDDDESDDGESYLNDVYALNDLLISFSIIYGIIRIYY
jgi:hypothetical protein